MHYHALHDLPVRFSLKKCEIIHQCDVLIRGLIEWKKKEFIKNGGIKEEMYRARKDWQRRNGYNGAKGGNGSNGTGGSNGAK